MKFQTRIRDLTIWACAAVWTAACGGGDEEPPPPPQTSAFSYAYAAGSTCPTGLPLPNDVFVDDDLRNEAGGCGLPSDAVEAAIARVMADEGVALDTKIKLPVEGVELQGASLTASTAFALAGTSSTGAIPPLLLFEQVGTATIASGWAPVAFTAAVVGTTVEITPAAMLNPARRHVLVATDEIRNARGNKVEASAVTKLLLGTAPIAAGAADGVDAAAAVRLERERVRLAPLVALLTRASPNLAVTKIVAITGFTTRLGYERLVREVRAYQNAAARDRFDFAVSVTGGDLTPMSLDSRYRAMCPPGRTVVGCYDHVRAFRRGTIRAPKVVDADGHLRPGWATTAIETVDVPFQASLPTGAPGTGSPVTILVPGFARGRLDGREIANDVASALGGIVLAIELDRHGERTANPTTGMPDLEDVRSNGTVESGANMPDGVPDKSGVGFFRGDPRAVRDTQIAAVIEVLHVIEALKRRTTFVSQGIEPDGRIVNLIAQGHSAQIGLHVAASTPLLRTLIMPAGGAGTRELVSRGPQGLKDGFLATAPAGVTAANLDEYLTRLEQTVLQGVSVEASATRAFDRLIRPNRNSPKVLLPHGEVAEHVPVAARMRLVTALTLAANRVSQHHGRCDNFFLYTCTIGDVFEWVVGAQTQISTFASSGGVTVTQPAP